MAQTPHTTPYLFLGLATIFGIITTFIIGLIWRYRNAQTALDHLTDEM